MYFNVVFSFIYGETVSANKLIQYLTILLFILTVMLQFNSLNSLNSFFLMVSLALIVWNYNRPIIPVNTVAVNV